ncbi:MAG: PD40 domain-containing protein [Phycisphaerae bacterium]|nr:PD40 domain-containing protein [Phycisphaerae bacterium]
MSRGEEPTRGAPASPSRRTLPPEGDESKYLANITQLTSNDMGLFNAGEAYFSPDGRTVIFQATPIGKQEYQIYTLDLKSNELRMVSTGKGACTCSFFRPDGKKIIFASSHLDPHVDEPKPAESAGRYKWAFNEHMDIFEADPDGSNLRRLNDAPGYDAEGAYAPDGKSIVFTSQRDGDLEIYVMDADGKNPRRITHGKGYDGGPFFSPDGKQIIYRGDRRGDENLQLRIVNADGTDDRAITDNDVFNWCPYWYPNGRAIIFTQADHAAYRRGERPNYDLYLTTPKGDRFVRVTFSPDFDGLPVFSPDGKKLMWTSKRGGLEEPQVFIADFTLPEDLR